MLSALQKSRQLYLITLDRVGDYMDLLRVELKIREHQMALELREKIVFRPGLFGLLATIFLGLAIIVTFWDSEYRTLAAWFVVLLYGGIAAVCLNLCLKHFRSMPLATTLRTEIRRDVNAIKEAL